MFAPNLKVRGPLYFNDIASAGTLRLDTANIEGEARIGNSLLSNSGTSLSFDGATFSTDLMLKPHLECAGNLYMPGIDVGGFLDISGAR